MSDSKLLNAINDQVARDKNDLFISEEWVAIKFPMIKELFDKVMASYYNDKNLTLSYFGKTIKLSTGHYEIVAIKCETAIVIERYSTVDGNLTRTCKNDSELDGLIVRWISELICRAIFNARKS